MKNYTNKTKKELIKEFKELQQQYSELKNAFEKSIVEKKRTEEALYQSEQKFFAMFEKYPFPTSLSKLTEGKIVDVNEAFEREFGLTKQEVFGKTTMELGINPDAENRNGIFEKLRKNGFVRHQEIVLRSKSGKECYYETNIDKMIINGEEYLLNTTRNIGEYKRVESKLKENYNLLQMAGEKAKLGGWNVILNGNLVYWSDEVAAIHEMPVGYIPPVEDGMNFYAPEWRKRIAEVFGKCALEGIPYDEEMEIITTTGKRVWVRTIGEAVYDVNGKIVKVQGAFQDISFRKKTEIDLKNSEARYKAIFESTGTATLIVDVDTSILLANNECFDMFGYDPSQLAGKKWTQFVAPESLQEMLENHELRRQSTEEIPKKYEVKIINSKGEKRATILNINMIPGTKQSVVSMLDITEKTLAEEELKKSKNSLEEYFENDISADYVVSVSGEILSCNKTFLNLFGFEKKSDTEKFDTTELYKNPKYREQMIALIKKQRKVENLELEFISREGKTIYSLINAIGIFDKQDKLEKIRGYIVDITEQKNVEKELYKSEEKYRLLFANNPQPMWIYDLETLVFLEVNQAALNHYGYSKEEFLSMSLKDIRPVEDIPNLLEDIDNFKSDLSTTKEWRHIKKNGEIIDVEITAHSLTFNERNARHILIKDITKSKKAENEILKLSHVIEQNPASIIITDVNGNIEYANPKTFKITGYTKEELIGENSRIFNSGEEPKEVYKELWSSILSGNVWFGEFHNKKKNGELYWESASISPLFNEKKEIINFVAIKEDITERIRFSDTRELLLEISQLTTKQITLTSFLAEVHQKLKKIIRADNFYVGLYNETDNTFSFPYHVDEHDKVELNKPYDFSSGYTHYVLKSNQSLVITPEYKLEIEKDGTIKGYGDNFSVWMGVPFNSSKNTKSNGVIAIQDYKNLDSYTDTDKAILEIIAFNIGSFIERIKYLEDLVLAKEKAEENEIELNKVQQLTHVGSWHLDLETNEVQWTEELYKMYGFDPTIPPPPYTEHMKLFTPESWEILSNSLAKTRETGISYELELRTIRKDKSLGWMWVKGDAIFDNYNKIIGLWGAAQDITERKNTEKQLFKAKEKAEESDRLKSAFLANMSHEIRTPMNGILGFTGLLKSADLSSDKKQKYIKIIEKSGQRMLNTVNDLVEISKIEAGLMTLSLKETDLNSSVEELFRFFKPDAEKKGLNLILEMLLPEENKNVLTDSNKFDSILSNLIKNAIKYTESGTIKVGCRLKDSVVEFYIKDTGIGIPKDRKEAIFERFVQADISDKMVFEGSGLGLAIAKSYVEMLGGSIGVVSKELIGSKFYFTLPTNNYTKQKTDVLNEMSINNETNKVKPTTDGLKILIAEDDETSRIFISLIVKDLSTEILEAATGIEAIELCRKNKGIDLILMDIKMPGMDGYEATRQIREFNKEVIIIAQTAYAFPGDRKKAIDAGCNEYIKKPIEREKLLKMVKTYFK